MEKRDWLDLSKFLREEAIATHDEQTEVILRRLAIVAMQMAQRPILSTQAQEEP